MTAETVAWFMYGGSRKDFVWKSLLQPLTGPQYLCLLVRVKQYETCT